MTGGLWALLRLGLGLADPLLMCTWAAMAAGILSTHLRSQEPPPEPCLKHGGHHPGSAARRGRRGRTAAQLAACSRESHTSRIHSRVASLQTTLGTIRTGGRWKQGRSSRLVRLQYPFGSDKSDHASQGLATTQANSPQWDIFQSPLSRVSHLTWRKCSPASTAISSIGPWSLALEGTRGNTREENALLLHVCSTLHRQTNPLPG